ncbi:MAG: hypothetical protein D6805_01890 [Planctomycetota bacterium]|nr:MAG: hypothetical protein D6805_01890 [Planctomycetota bacterium]
MKGENYLLSFLFVFGQAHSFSGIPHLLQNLAVVEEAGGLEELGEVEVGFWHMHWSRGFLHLGQIFLASFVEGVRLTSFLIVPFCLTVIFGLVVSAVVLQLVVSRAKRRGRR